MKCASKNCLYIAKTAKITYFRKCKNFYICSYSWWNLWLTVPFCIFISKDISRHILAFNSRELTRRPFFILYRMIGYTGNWPVTFFNVNFRYLKPLNFFCKKRKNCIILPVKSCISYTSTVNDKFFMSIIYFEKLTWFF